MLVVNLQMTSSKVATSSYLRNYLKQNQKQKAKSLMYSASLGKEQILPLDKKGSLEVCGIMVIFFGNGLGNVSSNLDESVYISQ